MFFNLDESGFSIRGMALGGREKCVVGKEVRPNTRYLKFQGSMDHVTVMPVVSATGQVYTPVVIFLVRKQSTERGQTGDTKPHKTFYPPLVICT